MPTNPTSMPQLPDSPNQSLLIRTSPIVPLTEFLPVAVVGMIFGTTWSVLLGQDLNWDFRNYYYYDVYAWLHHRVTYNIAPAQMQTWLNPLVFLPKYLLINHATPVVAGALFGLFEGISFAIVYAMARCIVQVKNRKFAIGISLAAAVGGTTAPQFLEGLGRTSSDNPVSMFVLLGLLAILWSIRPGMSGGKQSWGFAISGLLLGMATGLKLTCEVYAAGLTISLLVLWVRRRFTVRSFVSYAVGGIAGFLITGGYWSYFLWTHYQNPIFPYYNAAFHSDWALRLNYRDPRFLPHSFQEAITYPFLWFIGRNGAGESLLRDARIALLMVLAPIVVIASLSESLVGKNCVAARRAASERMVEGNAFWLLLLFTVVSYIYWMQMFAIQRYLVPLGLLSGLILFLLLDRLLVSYASKGAVFGCLVLFSVIWTSTDNRERVPYEKDWFGVQLSGPVTESNTLFVMAGGDAMSYIIPFLPGSDRFVRVSSNLPTEPSTKLFRAAEEAIKNHQGPIRSLTAGELSAGDWFQLARFGLEIDNSSCSTFNSKADRFSSCRINRGVKRVLLTASPQSQLVTWYVPGDIQARLYLVEDNVKRLVATGSQGYFAPEWLTPGRRYVFDLNEWAGSADGRLLARMTIQEDGRVQTEKFSDGMPSDRR